MYKTGGRAGRSPPPSPCCCARSGDRVSGFPFAPCSPPTGKNDRGPEGERDSGSGDRESPRLRVAWSLAVSVGESAGKAGNPSDLPDHP